MGDHFNDYFVLSKKCIDWFPFL